MNKKTCTGVALGAVQRKPIRDMIEIISREGKVHTYVMNSLYPQFTQLWNTWVDNLTTCGFINREHGWMHNPFAGKRTRVAIYSPGKNFDEIKKLIDVLREFLGRDELENLTPFKSTDAPETESKTV